MVRIANRRRHFLSRNHLYVVCLLASAAIGLPGKVAASTSYSYVGNAYSLCGGIYCQGGPYNLSLNFVTNLNIDQLQSLPFTNLTSSIDSYSFSDGTGLVVTQLTADAYKSIELSTDASGNPITWLVGGYVQPKGSVTNTQLQTNWGTYYSFHPGADFSETTASFAGDYGFVLNNPGAWTVTPVPEPEAYAMMMAGLSIIGVIVRRRKKG
jgi:hypothetical protein